MVDVIAVIGSRDYPDLDSVYNGVALLPADVEIVSGGHPDDTPRERWGVDETAISAAMRNRRPYRVFAPDPEDRAECGVCAFHRRNERIVRYVAERGGRLVAYSRLDARTGGPTPGTASTLRFAAKYGVPIQVNFLGVRSLTGGTSGRRALADATGG